MSQRFECQIDNKLTVGTPEVFLEIPGTGQTAGRLYDVKWQNGQGVPVNSYKHRLIIRLPDGVDIRQCYLLVRSNVDMDIKYRIQKREWRVKFSYCGAPHGETPAEINIILAPDEEVYPAPDPPTDPPESTGGN